MKDQQIALFYITTPCCDGYCSETHSIEVDLEIKDGKLVIRLRDLWSHEPAEVDCIDVDKPGEVIIELE